MPDNPFYAALIVAAIVAVVVAIAGGLLTEMSPWYYRLRQPRWKPPDWAFGPVWTVIFSLTVIATALAWEAAQTAQACAGIVVALGLNSVFNIGWSLFFFKLRRPDWAFVEVIFLWLSVAALILMLGSQSALAGLLIVPYLLWVSTASYLNWRVIQLNRPFARHDA
jgi:translocator protein